MEMTEQNTLHTILARCEARFSPDSCLINENKDHLTAAYTQATRKINDELTANQ